MGQQQLSRLHIAARIHFFLKREMGTGIHVEAMLKHASYARGVLVMCDRHKGTELERLGQQFRAASAAPPARPAAAGHGERSLLWAADTSGFGVSRPLEDQPANRPQRTAQAPKGHHWSPARWLGR
jgi:hypothetical protein